MKPTIQDLEQQVKELQDTIEKMKANKPKRVYDKTEDITYAPKVDEHDAIKAMFNKSYLGNFINKEDALRESERLHLRAEMKAKLDELWGDERPEADKEYYNINLWRGNPSDGYSAAGVFLRFRTDVDRDEFRKHFTDEQIIFALTEEF